MHVGAGRCGTPSGGLCGLGRRDSVPSPVSLALAIALCSALLAAPAEAEQAVAPVPLLSAQAETPGAIEGSARLVRDGEALVGPAARFAVEVGAPLADARLVLYDGQESLVEAEGVAEIGSASSRFTLAPVRPLRAGSRYVLRLEGAQSRELHDLAGRAFRPLSFPLLVSGRPPPDSAPHKAKKRKRRPPG